MDPDRKCPALKPWMKVKSWNVSCLSRHRNSSTAAPERTQYLYMPRTEGTDEEKQKIKHGKRHRLRKSEGRVRKNRLRNRVRIHTQNTGIE